MRKVKIITDSCADLGGKLLDKYNIDYARMSIVEDGVESPALLTWTEEEAHELYEKMRAGKRITTAQVSVDEFMRIFTLYLEEGYDIVYIGCASKQSGSVNTGYVTSKKALENYPDAKIFCIDALNATIGEGLLAIKASEMASEGLPSEEIAERITNMRNNVIEFATVHSLEYLKRAGRVSATSAFFGNLMGVKPILLADANGAQAAFKKVKGRPAAIKECVALMKENITDAENQTIYLWHSDCDKSEIDTVKDMIKAEIPCANIEVGFIGPIIGASVGPSVIGVWAFGKEVTFVSEA